MLRVWFLPKAHSWRPFKTSTDIVFYSLYHPPSQSNSLKARSFEIKEKISKVTKCSGQGATWQGTDQTRRHFNITIVSFHTFLLYFAGMSIWIVFQRHRGPLLHIILCLNISITLFKSKTMFDGTNNILWNIQAECEWIFCKISSVLQNIV